jgi:hypothetical protein
LTKTCSCSRRQPGINAAEHFRRLKHPVTYEQKTILNILNTLGSVKQKLEKDQPKMLDEENDAAVPGVMRRTEAIEKKVAALGPL